MDGPKSFRSENYENVDRLSQLPDSLILQILSFLQMRDVVRTTLLSKRWENLWTTVPCLTFKDGRKFYGEDDYENTSIIVKFVDAALTLWNGSKIQKFGIILYFDDSFFNDLGSRLDKWLDFATEHQVEELYLDLECEFDENVNLSLYFLPQRMYSCSSVTKLSLVSCCLKPSGDVLWDNLKSLSIRRVCLEENVMNQILSGSPQLEVLNLRVFESKSHLNISSSSLKKLKIEKDLNEDSISMMDTVLTMWAPNVEILEMSGLMYGKYSLMGVSSLTDVTLGFSHENWEFFCEGGEWSNYDERHVYDLRNEILRQVFQSIRHVQNITLSDWCIENNLDSLPSDAKFLKFYMCDSSSIEYEIEDLLKMFPKLTMLVLEDATLSMHEEKNKCIVDSIVLKFDEENRLKSKKRSRRSPLPHLRTAKINWSGDPSHLVGILQEYANKRGKIVTQTTLIQRGAPQ